ncbi:MAG: quinone-dependent dihydroorotate dehydrogenase [Intrasporangium sp.]|uniref:quinone-dependent dihydroorotate dehydrogenase n=1 Tax=Intrasporangium sp. TaxID=1925024 RepID=UPI0026484324|nr:quinone-dependent dihydroorotate dehydrogenase [Intrasporangium sp.]MDN5794832.1 quinone-dependent dihydroorotate dehydrogenase [Intrasporangium sp.]
MSRDIRRDGTMGAVMYERVLRQTLFRLGDGDPEVAHEETLDALTVLSKVPPAIAVLRRQFGIDAPRTIFGVRFPSPVGLAAGLDKNGVALRAWPAMGFGFVEVGTVTRYAQPGNPRPRLFRLPTSHAIINRMGFNNDGADVLAARLRALGPIGVPLGVSIGKSKATPVAEAVEDYLYSMRVLGPHADYFAVNVSSPNTPDLRSLQDRGALDGLLRALRDEAGPTPLLVKIAPDLTDSAIGEVLEVCAERRIDGLIATNTTIDRDGVALRDAVTGREVGGLSGRPLTERAREVVGFVHRQAPDLPVIGVGGITSVDDALRMFEAGASLIQLYTGFIYRGPPLVRAINRAVEPTE